MTFHMRRLLLATILLVAVGCSPPQPAAPEVSSARPSSSVAAAPPSTLSQFNPRWMGLVANHPQGWQELNRRITGDLQQFSLRPIDDDEFRFDCNGCAPWTVNLTAYAPYTFDPTKARTGRPVTVNADGDGYFSEDEARHSSTLAWQYAENAWATVHAMTTATRQFDRMVELARALRPEQRTPIRLPMSMPNVPMTMPLVQLTIDSSPLADDGLDYGTRLTFAPCARATDAIERECVVKSERLDVQIWPTDDYAGHFREHSAVPLKIGGRDGLFDDAIDGAGDHAAVRVGPGMVVVFDAGLPRPHYAGDPVEPPTSLKGVLAAVQWASDPWDEASWAPVFTWVR